MTSTTNFNQLEHKTTKQNPLPAGFTIIEVVLVLAIAGLVFLMAFIALPALQRNQRDTQRKNDAAILKDAIERYKANNRGRLPYSGMSYVRVYPSYTTQFPVSYLSEDIKDPSSGYYNFLFNSPTVTSRDRWERLGGEHDSNIDIAQGRKCDGKAMVTTPGENKNAIVIKLEAGIAYCIDG